MKPTTAIVIQAEATEQQLVERAKAAESDSHWVIGECAALCARLHNTTAAEFAQMCGMDPQQVQQRRRVYDVFADVRQSYTCITFSHFRAALDWDDSAECLGWAEENGASVREMEAWRRAQQGSSQAIVGDCDDEPEPAADHTCTTSEVVDHKSDCVTEEPDFDMDEAEADDEPQEWIEEPDHIEPETPVTRKPEVDRAVDWRKAAIPFRDLVASAWARNHDDDKEELKRFLRDLLAEMEAN